MERKEVHTFCLENLNKIEHSYEGTLTEYQGIFQTWI